MEIVEEKDEERERKETREDTLKSKLTKMHCKSVMVVG